MRDDFRVEIFQSDFRFLSKGVVEPQKYEFDYMALDNNELKVPGQIEAYKRNYIQIRSSYGIFQGIITSVEHQKTETMIKYKSLLSLLDIEVYKDRTALANTSA